MSGGRHAGRSTALLLADIIEWSERLAMHLQGVTRDRFERDALIQDAVARCVEVVGEASGRLLPDTTDPLVAALQPMLRMAYLTRNRLAHGYAGIDERMLWETAIEHIPALAAAVRALRASYET